jgi:transcriptional regulator with XRE-family HTH domain
VSVIPENQPTRVRRNEEIESRIGKRIRAARKHRKMSLSALGDELGLTYQQVQKYETGINRISASTLLKIADALEVKITYFFEGHPTTDQGDARTIASIPVNKDTQLTLDRVEDVRIRARLRDLVDAIGDVSVSKRKP